MNRVRIGYGHWADKNHSAIATRNHWLWRWSRHHNVSFQLHRRQLLRLQKRPDYRRVRQEAGIEAQQETTN